MKRPLAQQARHKCKWRLLGAVSASGWDSIRVKLKLRAAQLYELELNQNKNPTQAVELPTQVKPCDWGDSVKTLSEMILNQQK